MIPEREDCQTEVGADPNFNAETLPARTGLDPYRWFERPDFGKTPPQRRQFGTAVRIRAGSLILKVP